MRGRPGVGAPGYSSGGWGGYAAGVILAVAGIAAYHGTLGVPFLLDDDGAILENPALDLSHPWEVLFPPVAATTAGRPLLNLSFAVQHALHGDAVWGYHLVNLAIHIVAGLALLGVLRRVFGAAASIDRARGLRLASRVEDGLRAGPCFAPASFAGQAACGYESRADWFALLGAAIWLLHPIQTEAVTYISQRAESMAGMFVLVALWLFLRATLNTQHSTPNAQGTGWKAACVAACAAGVLSKETAVVGPLLILLVDRVFVAGSLGEAWRMRKGLYLGLAGCWVLLGALFLSVPAAQRGVAVGGGFFSLSYLVTQVGVVLYYLRLVFWPVGLVFDYGPDDPPWALGAPVALGILVVVLVGVVWLWSVAARQAASGKRPAMLMVALGVTAFLVALAPSSSVVPLTFQPAAENRVYLALAAVVAVIVGAVAVGRTLNTQHATPDTQRGGGRIGLIALAGLAVGLGVLTERRNAIYRDEYTIWADTAAKRPGNWRAQYNLALIAGGKAGQEGEAVARYEAALRLKPELPEAHNNIGALLAEQTASASGRPTILAEAIAHFETALRLKPDFAEAHLNLADSLVRMPGRRDEALAHYEAALKAKPGSAEARIRYGNALLADPARARESIPLYEEALKSRPESTEARVNLAAAYFQAGRVDDAIGALEEVVRRDPGYAPARENLERLKAMKR